MRKKLRLIDNGIPDVNPPILDLPRPELPAPELVTLTECEKIAFESLRAAELELSRKFESCAMSVLQRAMVPSTARYSATKDDAGVINGFALVPAQPAAGG